MNSAESAFLKKNLLNSDKNEPGKTADYDDYFHKNSKINQAYINNFNISTEVYHRLFQRHAILRDLVEIEGNYHDKDSAGEPGTDRDKKIR